MEFVAEFWNVPETTGMFLHELTVFWAGARESGTGVEGDFNILEIGTSNGYSGVWLARAVKRIGRGRVFTVESHAKRYELAGRNFLKEGVADTVVRILGHAPEVFGDKGAIKSVEGWLTTEQNATRTSEEENNSAGGTLFDWPRFDFVFFDATKMEYSSYLEAVLPLMKPGGLIVADNCLSHGRELAEFLKGIGEKGFLLPMDNGLLLVRSSTLNNVEGRIR